MPFLQDIIHRLELGSGMRVLRRGVTVLALITIVVCYNWRAFRNFNTQEAMDSAQLARNLAEGKGYTTLFIRPLSMYLVKKANQEKQLNPTVGHTADLAELKRPHPDLANPPVYPAVLAGMMKVLPFRYNLPSKSRPFWSNNGRFYRYEPDFLIGLFNQALFILVVWLVFLLARRLFDPTVGWLSAVLVMATESFWHFTVSGLSTILLMLIFLVLAWCLMLLESEGRALQWSAARSLLLAAAVGALVAVGCLTRYSFGWLLIPVVLFLAWFGGRQRVVIILTTLLVFGGLVAPWIVRNFEVSGTPFGTATYSFLETTWLSPGNRLQRSLEPTFATFSLLPFWFKLTENLRVIVQNDLPKLTGNWISAFFLVGLMIGFRNPSLRSLRAFLVLCIPVLAVAQALGHTQLAEDSPEFNSENLLVIVAPLVLLYGVGLFFLLLDQMNLPMVELRYLAIGVFSLIASLPMVLIFLPPRTNPVMYPPYNPPVIQLVASWMKPSELTMSDVPWAMAWYGRQQCVWLTLKATPDASDPYTHEDFLTINDYQKPISALYLTPRTIDARFFSEWVSAGEASWGSFVIDSVVNRELPPVFPLRKMPRSWLNSGELVLTDWERWLKPVAK